MSVRTNLVEVCCDGLKSGADCPENAAWTDYGTALTLRRRMADHGWKTALPGGIDRCPACARQGEQHG
jgi:hypothetical protein